MNNRQEWRAGTDPTNALSVLKLMSLGGNASGILVTWQSTASRTYFLERATSLNPLSSFSNLASNIAGLAGQTTYTDTNGAGIGPFFYRVGVQE